MHPDFGKVKVLAPPLAPAAASTLGIAAAFSEDEQGGCSTTDSEAEAELAFSGADEPELDGASDDELLLADLVPALGEALENSDGSSSSDSD